MYYVRSTFGSVSKTWNSINPATLSGAIDVIVVEQENGSLACSPFHVRFGKFSLLRPSDKKVEFRVNDVKQDYAMKLGEGGEAFFVFETSATIPAELQTSPISSPASSPEQKPLESPPNRDEPDPLDLDGSSSNRRHRQSLSVSPSYTPPTIDASLGRPKSGDWSGIHIPRSASDETVPTTRPALSQSLDGQGVGHKERAPLQIPKEDATAWNQPRRSASPPPVSAAEAMARAVTLSKKLLVSNIPNTVTESGDLMLDMTGYKSSTEDALRAEVVARQVLAEEFGGFDIGALIDVDDNGNLWIYSSEEAKLAASQKARLNMLNEDGLPSSDAVSDPGYHSDDARSDTTAGYNRNFRRDSDSAVELTTPPKSPELNTEQQKNYAKTLRLTSDQLKALNLNPGSNTMSFTVGRATCNAYMFYWKHDTPIVISDIDGTITKSDALGHVLNMLGRDWTHQGVAKLYTEIVNNGYNIFYLTSRSVGQADTTRAYLNGVVQDGYRLPKGPVIMSPDRTIAALRREIYLRKPEVFKMACLRDIMNLFGKPAGQTPFYAGFGNRFTDALSYRSVNIPSTRIFTINSNAEVSLDVLSLNSYKTGYASMREIVDHFFPPVGLLVPMGAEEYTDFNYWRDKPDELEFAFTDSEDEEEDDQVTQAASLHSEDEGSEYGGDEEEEEDLEASYISRDSMDSAAAGLEDSILESVEGDYYYEDEADYDGGVDEDVAGNDGGDGEDGYGEEEESGGTHAAVDDGLLDGIRDLEIEMSRKETSPTPTPASYAPDRQLTPQK